MVFWTTININPYINPDKENVQHVINPGAVSGSAYCV